MKYDIVTTIGTESATGKKVSEHLAIRKQHGEWVIDHTPTGKRIVVLKTEEAAWVVAKSIKDIIDWSPQQPEVPTEVAKYLRKSSCRYRVSPLGEPDPEPPTGRVDIEVTYLISLFARDLWPDGNWPETITKESVHMAIDTAGGVDEVVGEWMFERDCTVEVLK